MKNRYRRRTEAHQAVVVVHCSCTLDMTYLFHSFKLPSCQAGAKRRRERNESHSVSSLLNIVSVNNVSSESKKKAREA